MSRVLFIVPPLAGHINPTVALGAELVSRGHQVAWAGHEGTLKTLLPVDAEVFPALDNSIEERRREAAARWLPMRGGAAGLKFLWEDVVIPLGHAMMQGTKAAIESFKPDLVVCDQQAIAGAVVARLAGVPWVTSATTSAELARPLAALPKVERWIVESLEQFQREAGITDPQDLRFSEVLVICYTVPELIGTDETFPDHYVFTGPALTPRPWEPGFPWAELDGSRKRVLVSLGTLNAEVGRRFFATALEAVAPHAQLVISAPANLVPDPPPGTIVRDRVPQLKLLSHMDAVVCHGGHNTVVEALAQGIPLVVAPIRDDQPIIAQQVASSGAGIRVRFSRLRTEELASAVTRVMGEPSYREAAGRIREAFRLAGGAPAAIDRIEKVT
jgi:MGT family glycosyltransferase